MTPTVRGERPARYEICPMFTYCYWVIVIQCLLYCYWGVYRHFLEGAGFEVDFHGDEPPWGGKFPKGEYSRGYITLGDLTYLL